MKLLKKQRTQLLLWIAEGLESGEINKRAEKFKPTFKVTRQQVDHYRKTRDVELQKIKQQEEFDVLKTGLSLKQNRVKLLHEIADLLKRDLIEGNLIWTDEVKSIGSDRNFERIDYKLFNASEITQLRGILDDISAEVGERVRRKEVSGPEGGPIPVAQFDLGEWKKTREARLAGVKKLKE